MSRCILFDHEEQPMRGAGQFNRTMFAVCIHCGRTNEIGPAEESEAAPVLPNAFERLESPKPVSNDA